MSTHTCTFESEVQNPLIRLHPLSTIGATVEHLLGMAHIQERMAGTPRSREIDIMLANNMKLISQALQYLAQELSKESEDVKSDSSCDMSV